MIEGHVRRDGAWIVQGEVFIPQLGVSGLPVTFLMDPTQERTLLLPRAWTRVPNLRALPDIPAEDRLTALGGELRGWKIQALVRLSDEIHMYVYQTPIVALTESRSTENELSRLGRDILNQCILESDPSEGSLLLQPRTWDFQVAREP